MRITATVQVDMSSFVDHHCLYFGDPEIHHMYRLAPVSSPVSIELNIGDATSVAWTHRAVDALVGAQSVSIIGTSLRGVQDAMASLQGQFEGRAA